MRRFRLSLAAAALGLVASCTTNTSPVEDCLKSFDVSDCGGFEANRDRNFKDGDDYCDAERLYWSYDAATRELVIDNTRVLLNCCGNHSVTANRDTGGDFVAPGISVTEIDEPETAGRCGCMCVYDFHVVLEDVDPGQQQFYLYRQVSDDPNSSGMILDTVLDLDQGSGVIVINDDDVDPWCGNVQ